jgi:hypothetical protein
MSQFSLNKIPDGPGVYALYEHDRAILVGSAPDLRSLAEQHLWQPGPAPTCARSSRTPSGSPRSAGGSIPRWRMTAGATPPVPWPSKCWGRSIGPRFTLSSLGEVALADPEFVKSMNALFHGPPAGAFMPQTIDEMARSVYELEDRRRRAGAAPGREALTRAGLRPVAGARGDLRMPARRCWSPSGAGSLMARAKSRMHSSVMSAIENVAPATYSDPARRRSIAG